MNGLKRRFDTNTLQPLGVPVWFLLRPKTSKPQGSQAYSSGFQGIPNIEKHEYLCSVDIQIYGLKIVLILLVDDVHDARQAHRGMLETMGHEVIEASDGKGAIQIAATSPPDTIVMDLNMPDIDGLVAVAAIRTISPLRSVPIVGVTAFPQFQPREKALAAGCTAYLEKPLTIDNLASVLHKLSREERNLS